jgi:hypothetical protein
MRSPIRCAMGLAVAALVLTDAAAGDNPRAEAVIVLLEH